MNKLKIKTNLGYIELDLENKIICEADSKNIIDIRKELDTRINSTKFEEDITKIVIKQLKGGKLEKEMENIISNCIVQAFKQIWIKRSSWANGIVNKTT